MLCSSECPSATVGTISNPNAIRCHMTSSCDQISCCIYLAPVKRHIEVVTKFNFCGYKLEARIDKLKDTTDLLDYVWGKFHTSHCLHYSEEFSGLRVLKFKCLWRKYRRQVLCMSYKIHIILGSSKQFNLNGVVKWKWVLIFLYYFEIQGILLIRILQFW